MVASLKGFKVDLILLRSSILWLTNSGLSSSIEIWSKFWSLFSSISGLTKVKQSLSENELVIVFLITAFCFYLLFECKAIYRYYLGVKQFPLSSINWSEKSRTTHINWGWLQLLSWSMLETKFRTRLKVCNAFSSMLPTLLYMKVVERSTAKQNIFMSWLDY